VDPITNVPFPDPSRPWWQIPDFDPTFGDIKRIWELSRFDWVIAFSQHARNGDSDAIDRLNLWLNDWFVRNPPYWGPNWKCGQEASIRVIHLATAALILNDKPAGTAALLSSVETHLRRIDPSMRYAIAQDNNHGVSEASAMFIGGSWLRKFGVPRGAEWEKRGRFMLEERAERLIQKDGSFSQYSTNYHRMILDLYSISELWRARIGAPEFSDKLKNQLRSAIDWLHRLTDPTSGDAPVLGANDGARILPLDNLPYRDHRPSVGLARALFDNKRAWRSPAGWEHRLSWLGVKVPQEVAPELGSDLGREGGFAVLKLDKSLVVVRYPAFRFRPGHSDALHVDLWRQGVNYLRDGGSFSYNTDDVIFNYFTGVQSHNTIEFDGCNQMPRISRFLFGRWLRLKYSSALLSRSDSIEFSAGYTNEEGHTHRRTVNLYHDRFNVTDDFSGFKQSAVLRWRLNSADWRLVGTAVQSGDMTIEIGTSVPIRNIELAEGFESRRYMERTKIPTLELEVSDPGTINTNFRWIK